MITVDPVKLRLENAEHGGGRLPSGRGQEQTCGCSEPTEARVKNLGVPDYKCGPQRSQALKCGVQNLGDHGKMMEYDHVCWDLMKKFGNIHRILLRLPCWTPEIVHWKSDWNRAEEVFSCLPWRIAHARSAQPDFRWWQWKLHGEADAKRQAVQAVVEHDGLVVPIFIPNPHPYYPFCVQVIYNEASFEAKRCPTNYWKAWLSSHFNGKKIGEDLWLLSMRDGQVVQALLKGRLTGEWHVRLPFLGDCFALSIGSWQRKNTPLIAKSVCFIVFRLLDHLWQLMLKFKAIYFKKKGPKWTDFSGRVSIKLSSTGSQRDRNDAEPSAMAASICLNLGHRNGPKPRKCLEYVVLNQFNPQVSPIGL